MRVNGKCHPCRHGCRPRDVGPRRVAALVAAVTAHAVAGGVRRGTRHSKLTGISRFMLCSREMSVSVDTTPGMLCILLLSRSMSCSLSCA